MEYDFDKIVDRKNTNSSKYDEAFEMYNGQDLDVMSVADMEFEMPNCISSAIIQKVKKGILGYTSRPRKYFSSYVSWFEKKYGYKFNEDCMVHCPGVISGMRVYIELFTKKKSKILIFEPVYASFRRIIENTNRTVVVLSLIHI